MVCFSKRSCVTALKNTGKELLTVMNVNRCESKPLTKAVSRSSNWSVSFLPVTSLFISYHINSMVSSRFDAYLDFKRRRFS